MTAGCISLVVLSVPAFLLIEPGSYTMIFPGVLFIGFMLLCFSSTMPSALPALSPIDIRNGSLAVAFNITVAMFGGHHAVDCRGASHRHRQRPRTRFSPHGSRRHRRYCGVLRPRECLSTAAR
jgi:hypothetical protein